MSDIRYIRNSVVKMKWNSQWFLESRERGCFVAALEVYNGKPVVFQNNIAYTILDGDTNELASVEDIIYVVSDAFMNGIAVEDYIEEGYIPLTGSDAMPETLGRWGFTDEEVDDIYKRINDLSDYYAVEED